MVSLTSSGKSDLVPMQAESGECFLKLGKVRRNLKGLHHWLDQRTDSRVIGTFKHGPDADLIVMSGIEPHAIDDRLARCLIMEVV